MLRNMEVRFLKQEVVPVYDDWEREHIMPKSCPSSFKNTQI
jgi:hypothetical protein